MLDFIYVLQSTEQAFRHNIGRLSFSSSALSGSSLILSAFLSNLPLEGVTNTVQRYLTYCRAL